MVLHVVLNCLLALLFIVSGLSIHRVVFSEAGRGSSMFAVSNAFFLGLMLFLTLWVPAAITLGSAKAGMHLAMGGLILAGIFGVREAWRCLAGIDRKTALATLGMALLILLFHSRFFVGGYGHLDEMYKPIGDFLLQTDRMPILGLHYGQSLLGVVAPFVTGAESTFLSFSLWLPLVALFLSLLLCETLRAQGIGLKASLAGVVCLLLWNPALSLADVLFFSTGNPLLFILYPDDLASLAMMLQFFIVAVSYYRGDGLARRRFWVVLPLVYSVANNLVAPHNNIIMGFFLLFLTIVHVRSGIGVFLRSNRVFFLFAVSFVVLLAVGSRFAGPYSPLNSQTRELKLPTLSIEENSFALRPGFPYLVRGAKSQNIYYEKIEDVSFQNVGLMFWHIENALLKLAKVLFFPSFGLILAICRKRISLYPGPQDIGKMSGDAVFAMTNLFVLLVLFFISYGAFDKFGFTKLLLSYYMSGLGYFFLFMVKSLKTISSFKVKFVWWLAMLFPFVSTYLHLSDIVDFYMSR